MGRVMTPRQAAIGRQSGAALEMCRMSSRGLMRTKQTSWNITFSLIWNGSVMKANVSQVN